MSTSPSNGFSTLHRLGPIVVTIVALGIAVVSAAADFIEITGSGAVIDRSGQVRIVAPLLPASGEEAAIRIVGDDLTIDFAGQTLRGASATTPLDALDGIGVLIEGRNVTVRNLRLDGYRVGVLARSSDGLTLEAISVERNFAQRLESTPEAEASGDWLWPHRNDERQWRRVYGAAICVENSSGVTLRRITVRRSQNGIVLDRVDKSRVHDCDCSFLSGWGLAMWRSSDNVISRNAFDFCVRGYSHGVYNRGQDSAGILLFEQCSRNLFVENSATHGGDGVFGFAGREALGEARVQDSADGPGDDDNLDPDAFHARRGCNDNVFIRNDLSYAVAHGLELTFSFGNLIVENRFVGNAICGIWGGYSQDTIIAMNRFADNGDRGYGLERGGVNIEHGIGNRIVSNVFERNRCGVHLWWDNDEGIFRLPWARANDTASRDNLIAMNTFNADEVAIHLRENGRVRISGNTKRDVGTELLADDASMAAVERPEPEEVQLELGLPPWSHVVAIGETTPVGARRHLRGRDRIVMTEWGPYDWSGPLLHAADRRPDRDTWRLLGDSAAEFTQVFGGGPLRVQSNVEKKEYRVVAERPGWVLPYRLMMRIDGGDRLEGHGLIFPARWDIRFFAWSVDPREDLDAWRAEADAGVRFQLPYLRFRYGGGGPGDLASTLAADALDPQFPELFPLRGEPVDELAAALKSLPRDRFGMIATGSLRFPAGSWRIRTVSDDGVRVVANGATIIDNWTWHAPEVDTAELTFTEPTEVEFLVEHFELDGHAVLEFTIERVDGP